MMGSTTRHSCSSIGDRGQTLLPLPTPANGDNVPHQPGIGFCFLPRVSFFCEAETGLLVKKDRLDVPPEASDQRGPVCQVSAAGKTGAYVHLVLVPNTYTSRPKQAQASPQPDKPPPQASQLLAHTHTQINQHRSFLRPSDAFFLPSPPLRSFPACCLMQPLPQAQTTHLSTPPPPQCILLPRPPQSTPLSHAG